MKHCRWCGELVVDGPAGEDLHPSVESALRCSGIPRHGDPPEDPAARLLLVEVASGLQRFHVHRVDVKREGAAVTVTMTGLLEVDSRETYPCHECGQAVPIP